MRVFQREIAMVADAKKRIVLAMQMPHVALIVWQAALLGSIMVVMLEDDDDGVVVVKREDMNVPALPWLGSVLQVRLCTGLPMMQDAMMKAMRNVASAAVAMRRGRRCWEKRMELVRVYAVAMQALLNLGQSLKQLVRFYRHILSKKRGLTTTSVPTIADATATFSSTMSLTRLPVRPMTETRDTIWRSLRAMKTAPRMPNPGRWPIVSLEDDEDEE